MVDHAHATKANTEQASEVYDSVHIVSQESRVQNKYGIRSTCRAIFTTPDIMAKDHHSQECSKGYYYVHQTWQPVFSCGVVSLPCTFIYLFGVQSYSRIFHDKGEHYGGRKLDSAWEKQMTIHRLMPALPPYSQRGREHKLHLISQQSY